ncbi:class II histocompatibility antigen, B-L beta chain-like [Manacus candei]|uniref:class II histocompatibility antigen, B-L beta chain-like n=1 Tax=Manacus candei TaxID=415023 RepID=UPI002225FFAC|nr:class II histocompatibility antigen, B-L beta chain-like [Manacus candei]
MRSTNHEAPRHKKKGQDGGKQRMRISLPKVARHVENQVRTVLETGAGLCPQPIRARPKSPKKDPPGWFGAVSSCPALGMERVRGAGAVLAVLVVLGAPPAAGEELSGVFQEMAKSECHFINGTERVRLVERYIYNREQQMHFDSDVGVYVGDTPFGEIQARDFNSDPEWMEYIRSAVDRFCRHNYEGVTPFTVNRRVPPSVSISLVPSSSQPGPGRLLCSVMDFYPAPVQVRWFQDGQELPEHVVATDVVPNGDWTYQVLVLLEIPPRRGVTYSCQVEHVSLEHPLSRHWEMPPDTVRSKILVGVGGFVLGLVFLALGLGFYLREKSF